MLPSFFESVLTADRPHIDRPSARCAGGDETRRRRRAGRDARSPGAEHHRAEHRPRRGPRRRHLPGHRHADLRSARPGRREPDLDATADSRGGGGSHAARQAAAELGRLDYRERTRATTSGPGTPIIHFDQWERPEIEVKLILKGGGCENTNAQYALPMELPHLGRADRTLDGVRKCILHAVWNAQGKGCSPGAVGVCVGGDRTSGYLHAKEQLFRTLDDVNPDRRLAELEASIMSTVNTLEIGPMGFGGKVTLIGCKVGALNRLPASFFVSVAYDCWAFRRLGVLLNAETGAIDQWLYRDPSQPDHSHARPVRFRAHRSRGGAAGAAHRRGRARAEGGRRGADLGPHVHRPRRGALAPDEARAAGRPERLRALSLRTSRREGGRRLARHRGRPDDEHSRRAVPGRDHQALRRARGHRQGRHGSEDAGGAARSMARST